LRPRRCHGRTGAAARPCWRPRGFCFVGCDQRIPGALPHDRNQRLAPRRTQSDPEMARADLRRCLPLLTAGDRPRPGLRIPPQPCPRAGRPASAVRPRIRGAWIMARLGDLAKLVPSKNAGPFWLPIDIMFDDVGAYRRARDAEIVSRAAIARLYNRNPAEI